MFVLEQIKLLNGDVSCISFQQHFKQNQIAKVILNNAISCTCLIQYILEMLE